MSAKTLYYGQPIDRGHPLNRGLVAEWAVVPWYASGPRLIDLAGYPTPNPGTLTNAPLWAGAVGRPGGSGSLRFAGSSLNGVALSSFALGSAFSLSVWVCPDAAIVGNNCWMGAFDGGAGWLWRSRPSDATEIEFYSGSTSYFGGAGSLVAGAWQHLVVTLAGGVYTLYRNGVVLSTSGGGQADPVNTAGGVYIGRLVQANAAFAFPGLIDAAIQHNRALSASEVYALYNESRRGNPARWSRIEDQAYSFAPPPPGGPTVLQDVAHSRGFQPILAM